MAILPPLETNLDILDECWHIDDYVLAPIYKDEWGYVRKEMKSQPLEDDTTLGWGDDAYDWGDSEEHALLQEAEKMEREEGAEPKYKLCLPQTKQELEYASDYNLYRIQALRTFYARDFGIINIGDKGGWVQSTKNLSFEGSCWIHGNARVTDRAYVSDDAQVSGDAIISRNAIVSGDAIVDGNVTVGGNAAISNKASVTNDDDHNRAYIDGQARINGNACIRGDASIGGFAIVTGNAWVFGPAIVKDIGIVKGKSIVRGGSVITE